MIRLKNEAKFHRMMKDYLELTSKSVAEAMNYKAYMIALFAIRKTKKTTAGRIKKFWNSANTKKSKIDKTPLVPKIVSAWKGYNRKTQRGVLEGSIEEIRDRRLKSIGFLRSGWIPAIKALASHTGGRVKKVSKNDSRIQKIHGKAKKAKRGSGLDAVASIENYTGRYSDDAADALAKFGKAGLEKGIEMEARETVKYLAKKFQKDADKLWNLY